MFNRPSGKKIRYTFPLQLDPDVTALARTVDASISATTEIALQPDTSYIKVYAITKDVYLKWGTDDVSASNFDHVIPAGTIERFLVPNQVTAINVIERESAATVIVAEY